MVTEAHKGTSQVGIRSVYCVKLIWYVKQPDGTADARPVGVLYLDSREKAWLNTRAVHGSLHELAADVATAAAAAPLSATTSIGERPRVLVVDDEAGVRDLLAKTLALAEYEVDLAPDGRAALERLRLFGYDLLISDLKMPGMDGLSVIHEARRLHANLPVIIITGFSTEASAVEAANLGVAGYLAKPFKVPQVLAVSAKALGQ
jgi:CheY-like chemotaxis protein